MNREVLNIAREKIGVYFKAIIKDKNIAIEKIARDTGMNKSVIYNIINGKGYSIDSFLTLCAYFNLHLDITEQDTKPTIIENKFNEN